MKLTASTNFCYIIDRNAFTVKVNIKETLMGNNVAEIDVICDHF